jgi:HSP20 family molecular chaperone IbpA
VVKAEVPADSGVTAKVDDGKLTVSAAKDAKEGSHNIAIKGGKKDATLKVNVKKAG